MGALRIVTAQYLGTGQESDSGTAERIIADIPVASGGGAVQRLREAALGCA